MVRLRSFRSSIVSLVVFPFLIVTMNCGYDRYKYRGELPLTNRPWLIGKKVFIDPGHGGAGKTDPYRIGPNGGTEENINLRVSLVLADMLKRAGVQVRLSRRADTAVPLDERVDMAAEFGPDLLISIHHNGSPRTLDRVNYPAVLIWGCAGVRPASFDFARLLLDQFHRIMPEQGTIVSDFTVFRETGTRILRKTRYLCPGVIGEAGFFSDVKHAVRLNDMKYNEREAEAYFSAISHYFKQGVPTARIHFSCPVLKDRYLKNLIQDRRPLITIETVSGNEHQGIDASSLSVTLDDLRTGVRRIGEGRFKILYGRELYPGIHRLRFSFRNLRHQSSMVLSALFSIAPHAGEYTRLVARGCSRVRRGWRVREGLRMLLSAYSLGQTGPGDERLTRDIARGFRRIGYRDTADYYMKRLYYFYPMSRYNLQRGRYLSQRERYRYPVEYYGKAVPPVSAGDDALPRGKGGPSLMTLFKRFFPVQ